jgi:Peptidylarginine deiminase and related enzymes
MEGGSVDFNGKGTLITSTLCLLNQNRNPHLNQKQIEEYLYNYYGMEQVLWVDEGIVGDDTDGHIDDTVRFVNEDTVITVVEENKNDENHALLETNLKQLKAMRLLNGKQLNIVELPMPDYLEYDGQRLPCSYANFYICNKYVIVPIFNCKKDDKALQIISNVFPEEKRSELIQRDHLGSWKFSLPQPARTGSISLFLQHLGFTILGTYYSYNN